MVEIKKEDLTPEQLEQFMNCKTAPELVALVKKFGYDMTLEEAEAYLEENANIENEGEELSDEELDAVAGGIDGLCVGAKDCFILLY